MCSLCCHWVSFKTETKKNLGLRNVLAMCCDRGETPSLPEGRGQTGGVIFYLPSLFPKPDLSP